MLTAWRRAALRLARPRQRIAFVVVAVILAAWGLMDTRPPAVPGQPGPNDTDLFRAVVERVRAGQPYYPADFQEMLARGYPTASVFNWRLPTLTFIQARLPSVGWSVAILSGLGLGTAYLWLRVLANPAAGMTLALVVPLLLATLPAWPWFAAPSAYLHDLWAGQLIALSLACWGRGHRRWSLVAGLLAALVRTLAVPYVLVMGIAAMREHDRREALAWLAVLCAFLLLLAWHVAEVLPMTAPDVLHRGWLAFGGWRHVLQTARVNVLLTLAPSWVVALAVPMLWLAFAIWRTPVGRRAARVVTLYLVAFTVIGRPDTWYWGLLVSPLLPVGVTAFLASRSWTTRRPSPQIAGTTQP